ncbi:uncharacterized protein LOC118428662 [Branchiostoma floridae]|uniref:Uncharacterized protein LOC118428662 n=1 Tax=Branchiostoma floridae TaxID=7739 RepID=A0A9J7N9U4_BRAFL|nr:uncharacterized protein LOC118428662 [Branchiostoma floridae]
MGNQASHGEPVAAAASAESFDPRLEALFARLAEEKPGQDPCVTEDGFRQLFGTPLPAFGSVMFNAIAPNPASGSVGHRAFLIGAQETLNLAGLSSQIKYYHDVFFEKEGVTEEGVRNMVHTAFTLCLASINLDPEALKGNTSILDSLASSVMKTCSKQTGKELHFVIQSHYLQLFSGLHTYVQKTLLGAQEGPNEELTASVRQRFAESMMDLPMAWVLSCILPIRYTKNRAELVEHSKLPKWLQWSQLYSSREHGQSLSRFEHHVFEHHVFSYKDPTILLISCAGGFTFCIAVDSEWRESTAAWGAHDCLLLQLTPEVWAWGGHDCLLLQLTPEVWVLDEGQDMRFMNHHAAWGGHDCLLLQLTPEVWVLDEGQGMMFVNHHARTVKNGIYFGRNFDSPLVSLQSLDSLQTAEGELAITNVEVWGCGDEGALKEQQRWRDWEHRQAEKTQKVKRPGRDDWQDNPDKFLLDMVGVETQHPQERPGM